MPKVTQLLNSSAEIGTQAIWLQSPRCYCSAPHLYSLHSCPSALYILSSVPNTNSRSSIFSLTLPLGWLQECPALDLSFPVWKRGAFLPSGLRWVSKKMFIKCLAPCKCSVSVSFFSFLCMEAAGCHLRTKHRVRPEVYVCVSRDW